MNPWLYFGTTVHNTISAHFWDTVVVGTYEKKLVSLYLQTKKWKFKLFFVNNWAQKWPLGKLASYFPFLKISLIDLGEFGTASNFEIIAETRLICFSVTAATSLEAKIALWQKLREFFDDAISKKPVMDQSMQDSDNLETCPFWAYYEWPYLAYRGPTQLANHVANNFTFNVLFQATWLEPFSRH